MSITMIMIYHFYVADNNAEAGKVHLKIKSKPLVEYESGISPKISPEGRWFGQMNHSPTSWNSLLSKITP